MNHHNIADLATGSIIGAVLLILLLADPPIAGVWLLVSLAYSSRKKKKGPDK